MNDDNLHHLDPETRARILALDEESRADLLERLALLDPDDECDLMEAGWLISAYTPPRRPARLELVPAYRQWLCARPERLQRFVIDREVDQLAADHGGYIAATHELHRRRQAARWEKALARRGAKSCAPPVQRHRVLCHVGVARARRRRRRATTSARRTRAPEDPDPGPAQPSLATVVRLPLGTPGLPFSGAGYCHTCGVLLVAIDEAGMAALAWELDDDGRCADCRGVS